MLTVTRINYDVLDALTYADGNIGLLDIPYAETSDFTPYKEAAGTTIVEDLNLNRMEPQPGVVLVNTPEELRVAFDALNFFGLGISELYAATSIRHERQHAEATEYLGFQESQYGIIVRSPHPCNYRFTPFHRGSVPSRPITKLEVATMCAMPSDPSPSDLEKVTALGYLGLRDLAMRIARHNEVAVRPIPLPHSCTPAVV